MFEVGFTEIILIMGLALLVLGPERLPDLARKVGRWTGKARAMARQFQSQLEQEVTLEQITRTDAERRIHPQPGTHVRPEDVYDPPPHMHELATAPSEPPHDLSAAPAADEPGAAPEPSFVTADKPPQQ